MKYVLLPVVLLMFSFDAIYANDQPCPPQGYTDKQLLSLKNQEFVIEDDAERNRLALALTACVSSADPAIRDGVAFEGLSTWLRGEALSNETVLALLEDLSLQMMSTQDPNGFQQPFAALILSEVARVDRVSPVFTEQQRDELVTITATYLAGVSDYRGYSDDAGWRHGVAHASDLALQLTLNQNINASQLKSLLTAIAGQVAADGEVSYIFGEPSRLARPVFYAWRRGLLSEEYWQTWFESIVDPSPFESWGAVFSSESGLARRHNVLSFLTSLHLNVETVQEEGAVLFSTLIDQAIMSVLRG